jgi:TolB-like protein/Flp pilus assembly protein TadD
MHPVDARRFFAELKRRKVYRVAVAYAIVAWLLIQIATQTLPFFEIPTWTVRLIIVALVLGFPVALLLSWAFDLTPEGIKRTDDVDEELRQKIADSLKTTRAERVAPPEKSVAVLPFDNFSDDARNAYFADGIQDDILSSLAKVADLKVTSRTSVRQFKTGTRNLREIGEALGVAYIVEGSVRRESNRVRINAQLIDARIDQHVWNDTYDREITDLFELQSELARRITFALRANLSPREKAGLQIHSTADMAAYELFLRARDLFRWSGSGDPRENGEQALRLLNEALERDPQFALAHCLVSRVHGELYWFGYDRSRARLSKAKIAADHALRLQPDLGDARLALAYYYYYGYRDYELARTELAIALEATPNDAEVWDAAGAVDRRQGRWEEAVPNFEKARQLDPRNNAVIWNLAETYACLGRYADAASTLADGEANCPDAHFFSLAHAAIDLRTSGSTAPLRAALGQIPQDFDPGCSVTVVALRVSLMDRNYAEAADILRGSRAERFNDTGLEGPAAVFDGYDLPRAYFEGLVARGQGEKDAAERAFAAAQALVETDMAERLDDAKAMALIGVLQALRGNKDAAIRAGRRAVELLPVSKDAYDGPLLATKLAVIYAQVGETERALEMLADLMKLPNGPTPGTLRVEPEWDPLRGDPRFEKLANAGS